MWLSHKTHELKAAEITEKANTSKAVMSTKVVIAAAMARMAIEVNIIVLGDDIVVVEQQFVTDYLVVKAGRLWCAGMFESHDSIATHIFSPFFFSSLDSRQKNNTDRPLISYHTRGN